MANKIKDPNEVKNDDFVSDMRYFLHMSRRLTGFGDFDLHGTGMLEQYRDTLIGQVGAGHAVDTYRAVATATLEGDPGKENLKFDGKTEKHLVDIARSVAKMWYLGAWYQLPPDSFGKVATTEAKRHRTGRGYAPAQHQQNESFVVSPEAYTAGLVWKLSGGHPLGARPPGYATWAAEPGKVPQPSQVTDPQT